MQSRLQGIQHLPPTNFALENHCQKLSFFLSIHTHGYVFALGVFGRILFSHSSLFYLIEFHPESLSGLIRCYTHTCVSDGKQHYVFFVCYDSRFLGEILPYSCCHTIICCETSIIRGILGPSFSYYSECYAHVKSTNKKQSRFSRCSFLIYWESLISRIIHEKKSQGNDEGIRTEMWCISFSSTKKDEMKD